MRFSIVLPDFVEPMKCRLVEKPPVGDWVYEIKWDGWRSLALCDGKEIALISRNNKPLTSKFPEIVQALARKKLPDTIIDGEIVALDDAGRSDFGKLQAHDMGERPPIHFYAFDVLRLRGKDLRDLPLVERKKRLQKVLGQSEGVLRFSADMNADVETLLTQARSLRLEGLIGKRRDSSYESGRRSGAWIKIKLLNEQEFVIGGFTPPENSRQHFGSILCGYYDGGRLIFAGKVGTGFTAKTLAAAYKRLMALRIEECPFVNLPIKGSSRWSQGISRSEMNLMTWVRPETVAQVKFSEWTGEGRLRQPVFLGFREDKAAKDVRRERAG